MLLAAPLNLANPAIAAIGMPVQNAGTAAGTIARVAGWGAIYEDGPGSILLQSVEKPVVTNAACNAAYGGGITAGMICAGFPQGNFSVK